MEVPDVRQGGNGRRMSYRLPPLIALRAFDAVARTGSVRTAGGELHVSHTAVSRHVHNLQTYLGAKLVERAGRGLVLTAAGARFHKKIAQAFDTISLATAELTSDSCGKLEIWCTPGIAAMRLLPHLPRLENYLPSCQISMRPTRQRPNLSSGEADAEIVFLFDGEERRGCEVELLNRPRMLPVASPAFLARTPEISEIRDLLHLPLIHEESTDQWMRWFNQLGFSGDLPLRGPRLWNGQQTLESAKLGQGVALTGSILVDDCIRSGELVEVFTTNIFLGSYCLVTAKSKMGAPSIVALRQWLSDVLTE